MKWDLEFGGSIDKLQALRAAGRPVPALDRRPELPPTLEWVWEAYAEFNNSRAWILGNPQPIPLTEINAYAQLMGLGREETEELLGFVRKLDVVYFEHLARKAKAESGKARSRNRRPSGPAR